MRSIPFWGSGSQIRDREDQEYVCYRKERKAKRDL